MAIIFTLLQRVSSNLYYPILEKDHPETQFFQEIHLSWHSGDLLSLNLSIDGNSSSTFLDIEEEEPRKLIHVPNYKERIHTFKPNPSNKESFTTSKIIIKGIFDKASFNINTDTQKNEYITFKKNKFPDTLAIALLFTGAIIMINCRQRRMILLITLVLAESLIPLFEVVSDAKLHPIVIFQKPYRFPTERFLFSKQSTLDAIQDILKKQNQEDNFENCKHCTFTPVKSQSNSSPRDFILTVGYNGIRNADVFIRSARTSGCKAHIVIFTNQNVRPYNQQYKDCGATFIQIETISLQFIQVQTIRYQTMAFFLNHFPKENIDRVIYSDFYDTTFQGDPFLTNVTANSYIVSDEGKPINEDDWAVGQLKDGKFMGLPYSAIKDAEIACSGSFLAGYEPFLFVVNTISNWYPLDLRKAMHTDQMYYDVLVSSDAFRSIGFEVVYSPNGGFVSSLHIFQKEYSQEVPAYRKTMEGPPPLLLHHTNRLTTYYYQVGRMCRA